MTEYPRKQWLEDAIFEYILKNEGIDSVDIVSHFKLSSDITLMSLRELINEGKIIEKQPYLKNEYYVNKYR